MELRLDAVLDTFTDEEQQALAMAPFAAAVAVAALDGRIEQRELLAAFEWFRAHGQPLFEAALQRSRSCQHALISFLLEDLDRTVSILGEACRALDARLPFEQAREAKVCLLGVARATACATKKPWFSLWFGGASMGEQAVLDLLAAVMGLQETQG